MISPATPPAGREALAYRRGHVVAVYLASRIAERVGQDYKTRGGGVGMPRTGYIHTFDIPDRISFAKFSKVLRRGHQVWAIPAVNPLRINKRRRNKRLVFSGLPLAVRNGLRDDREVTMSFIQLKSLMRRLTVIDEQDPTTDTETQPLDDTDFD